MPNQVSNHSLSLAQLRQVEEICTQFESAWRSGPRPRIEECVGSIAEPLRSATLGELLNLDIAYRQQAGEKPVAQDYLDRFPHHAQLILDLFGGTCVGDRPPSAAPVEMSLSRSSISTPVSLLEQLRQTTDDKAWKRFVQLYTPLLYHWARRVSLQQNDAFDLVQDVFTVLVKKLPEFTYDPAKRFRGWLWTVTRNKWREGQRLRAHAVAIQGGDALAGAEIPDTVAQFGEAEYRQHLVKRLLQMIQAEFQPSTWKACWENVVAGRPAADVARELGISVNAVHLAKSRVLRRMRQELDGLMD